MDEKMKNLLIYNMYVTDKERDEMAPVLAVVAVILLVLAVALKGC